MNRQESYRILIVDDNFENVKTIGSILRENGYLPEITTGQRNTAFLSK